MTRLALALAASALLSSGCARRTVIPSAVVPHQLARPARVSIWARAPDGKMVRTEAEIPAGWWVAGPPVVEGDE